MDEESLIKEVAAEFPELGAFVESARLKIGHIHDTFIGVFETEMGQKRFVFQRLNKYVFKDPVQVVKNIEAITEHQKAKLTQAGDEQDLERRVLSMLSCKAGNCWHQDKQGEYWRIFHFIENACTFDTGESEDIVFEASRAFGEFQLAMSSLESKSLIDTIPDFHNIPKRFETLEAAIESDSLDRSKACAAEIEDSKKYKELSDRIGEILEEKILPLRVVHNDTKVNNVMIDNDSRKAVCVIDLDTCMLDLAIHDFGQLVRTSASTAREDERNLELVGVDLALFKAIARGYISAAKGFLTEDERDHLVFSAEVMAYENAIRFLTDYLTGDKYFKIQYETHNLDRCRNQFALLGKLREHKEVLEAIVLEAWEEF